MFVPSKEQQTIVDAIRDGNNVAVDAVAGSGKTTTVLAIAAACSDKQIFQITFNSQLKSEVRAKVVAAGLDNLSVHTYHSIATTFYDKTAYTDTKIIAILTKDKPIKLGKKTCAPSLDIIIIDEAQDMTMLYYRLVNKFIRDASGGSMGNGNVQVVVMGDRFQGVYEFMKADTRFLTLAANIWNKPFVHLSLSESYRVTEQIAWFINSVMIGHERIISKKKSKLRVEWRVADLFKPKVYLKDLIKDLKNNKIDPEDVFVLAPSLKSIKAPAKCIENLMVTNGIPVYVPISEEGKLDDDVTRGKVVFATLPSSKGRERPIVVLLNFDENYFNFYAKSADRSVCPSSLYVATTRAKERLILVSDKNASMLTFLTDLRASAAFSKNVDLHMDGEIVVKIKEMNDKKNPTVTELVKYLKQDTIKYLTPIVDSLFVTIEEPSDEASAAIPSKVRTGVSRMHEDVFDINGLTIPGIWEAKLAASSFPTMYSRVLATKSLKQDFFIQKMIKNVKMPCKTISDFLYLSTFYSAAVDGYHGRLAQIEEFDWLTQDMVDKCSATMDKYIEKKNVEFEVPSNHSIQTMFGHITITGRLDIVTDPTVWEIKCVDCLQLEHMLQVILYYWLHKMTTVEPENGPVKTFKLLNVRTGEIRELVPKMFLVQNVIDSLISQKYMQEDKATDEEFIADAMNAVADEVKALET